MLNNKTETSTSENLPGTRQESGKPKVTPEDDFLRTIINVTTGWRSFHGCKDHAEALEMVRDMCEDRQAKLRIKQFGKHGWPGQTKLTNPEIY